MSKRMRCKACGFVTEEGKIGDVCPACGVPAKMFEPHTDRISEERRRMLDRHLHPVIVHAPQAFAFFLLLFSAAVLFQGVPLRGDLQASVRVMALCLPFTLVGALLSGLEDAKTRFRRYSTPILKRKIIVGLAFLALSVLLAAVVSRTGPDPGIGMGLSVLILSAGCLICSALLGLLGSGLLDAKFPG